MAGFSIEIDYHWLIIFISGYIIRKLFDAEIYHLIISAITGIITIVLSYLRIVNPLNNSIKIWWHVLAGIFIFMFLYYLLKKFNIQMTNGMKKFFDFTDTYTYDIYITHAIFITGYFSVLEITPYIAINFFILVVMILFSAYILYCVSKFVNKEIDKVL